VDLNLDTLKHEILDYLGSTGFAIFHGAAGGLDGLPMVLWDTERYPDYRMFLDVAQKAGVKLILFASRELEADEIDEVAAQLEACELSREEYREYESRLSGLRAYEGVTCTLELAFDYNSRLHVYEVQPDWFEDFLGIEDELMTRMADDDMGEDDSLGGYYSKN
jgi:hypothetical protein